MPVVVLVPFPVVFVVSLSPFCQLCPCEPFPVLVPVCQHVPFASVEPLSQVQLSSCEPFPVCQHAPFASVKPLSQVFAVQMRAPVSLSVHVLLVF